MYHFKSLDFFAALFSKDCTIFAIIVVSLCFGSLLKGTRPQKVIRAF